MCVTGYRSKELKRCCYLYRTPDLLWHMSTWTRRISLFGADELNCLECILAFIQCTKSLVNWSITGIHETKSQLRALTPLFSSFLRMMKVPYRRVSTWKLFGNGFSSTRVFSRGQLIFPDDACVDTASWLQWSSGLRELDLPPGGRSIVSILTRTSRGR